MVLNVSLKVLTITVCYKNYITTTTIPATNPLPIYSCAYNAVGLTWANVEMQDD